jgi:hypothetical protein
MNWFSYWLGVATPFAGWAIAFLPLVTWSWLYKVLKRSVPYACSCSEHLDGDIYQPDTLFHGWPWQRWTQWWLHRISKMHRRNTRGIRHSTSHTRITYSFGWRRSFELLFKKERES